MNCSLFNPYPMHLLALLLTLILAAPIPSVYIILGIITLLIIGGAIYFYVRLWKNRKKTNDKEIHNGR